MLSSARRLHSTDLERWPGDFLEAHDSHPTKRAESASDSFRRKRKKIKELEREVRRRDEGASGGDGAADTQKKAELIWGLVEDRRIGVESREQSKGTHCRGGGERLPPPGRPARL